MYFLLTFFHGDQSHNSLPYTDVVILSLSITDYVFHAIQSLFCHFVKMNKIYFSPCAVNHYTFSLYLFYQLRCCFDRVLIDCLEGIFVCNC